MEILDDYILEEELSEKEVDWQLFLGKEFDYYRPIWNKIEQGKKAQFNIFSFIFSSGWAGYRKMYKVFFLFFAINFILDFIPYFFSQPGLGIIFLCEILFYILFILWGFFGNFVYYKHAQKKITKIKAEKKSKDLEERAIEQAGGTDIVFPFIVSLILIGLNIILKSFFGFA